MKDIFIVLCFFGTLTLLFTPSNNIELNKSDWECKDYHQFNNGKHCSIWVEKNHHGEEK